MRSAVQGTTVVDWRLAHQGERRPAILMRGDGKACDVHFTTICRIHCGQDGGVLNRSRQSLAAVDAAWPSLPCQSTCGTPLARLWGAVRKPPLLCRAGVPTRSKTWLSRTITLQWPGITISMQWASHRDHDGDSQSLQARVGTPALQMVSPCWERARILLTNDSL